MSGIRSAAKGVHEAYAHRQRSRNPRTNVLRERKETSFRRFNKQVHLLRKALVRAFVGSAVQHFAQGSPREGRYFYDGAFAFGDRDLVRGVLLRCGLAAARQAQLAGDHQAVWRLLDALHSYPPDGLDHAELNTLFAKFGVRPEELKPSQDEAATRRLRGVGVTVLVPAVA